MKTNTAQTDYSDLGTLFRRTITATTRAPTRTAPAMSAHSSGTASAGAFSTPAKRATILVPAIVGGLLLAALAAWLLLRYRRSRQTARPSLEAYKERNPGTAPESLATAPYSSPPTAPGWGDSHPGPPPIGYAARAYSDYSGSSQTPRRSPAELPLGQTPMGTPLPHGDYGQWVPPPLPLAMRGGVVPGHYPPPLPNEYVEGRSPEMKERPREGQGW